MSVQPTTYFPGSRLLEGSGSDFQQMVSRVLSILRQRRWLFVLPLLAGLFAGLAGSLFIPRKYVIGSMFERRDDVVITNLLTNNSPYSFETLRRSLPIDLVGYNAVSEVIEQLGLDRGLPRDAQGELTAEGKTRRQALLNRITKQLDVNLAEKSTFLDLIEVKYAGDQPDLGVKLVTRLKDNYISHTRQRISDILTKSHDFFNHEANKHKERAASLEAELLQMAVTHPGVDPNDPGVLDQRLLNESLALDELTRRRNESLNKLRSLEEYLSQLEGRPAGLGSLATQAASPIPTTVANPQRQRLETEIEKVRVEITDAKTLKKMTDEHPIVAALRQKIVELQKQAEAVPASFAVDTPVGHVDPGISPLDTEKKRVRAEMNALQGSVAQTKDEEVRHQNERARLEEEKGHLFERRQSFLARQQEVQAAKSDLNVWQNHVETIARVLTAETEARGIQFSTVDEARRPPKPVSPTLAGIILVSLALGIAFGTAAVFLREVLDRSLRSVQRVRETLGVPVLESIGAIRLTRGPAAAIRRCVLPVLATLEAGLVVAAGALAYLSVELPTVYEHVIGPLRQVLPV